MVYCAIGHLTNNLDYTRPIRLNQTIFIQTQANINKMYEIVKRSEQNNVIKPVEKVKKNNKKNNNEQNKSEEKIELEKMNDRLSGFNELNNFII